MLQIVFEEIIPAPRNFFATARVLGALALQGHSIQFQDGKFSNPLG